MYASIDDDCDVSGVSSESKWDDENYFAHLMHNDVSVEDFPKGLTTSATTAPTHHITSYIHPLISYHASIDDDCDVSGFSSESKWDD